MTKYNLDYFYNNFPKTRPPLDKDIEKIYTDSYYNNREGETPVSSLTQKLESWMHRKINRAIKDQADVFEIGAGTLNHLKFPKNYRSYDVVEPFGELYKNSPNQSKVSTFYNSIDEAKKTYDYIFSIAVLEHLTHLPFDIAKAALLLRPGGKFLAAIPSEGGLLWGLSWRFSTGIEFWLKYRMNYKKLMHHEHVNDYKEIQKILNFLFQSVKIKRLGIGNHFSFYQYLECANPNTSLCEEMLHKEKNHGTKTDN